MPICLPPDIKAKTNSFNQDLGLSALSQLKHRAMGRDEHNPELTCCRYPTSLLAHTFQLSFVQTLSSTCYLPRNTAKVNFHIHLLLSLRVLTPNMFISTVNHKKVMRLLGWNPVKTTMTRFQFGHKMAACLSCKLELFYQANFFLQNPNSFLFFVPAIKIPAYCVLALHSCYMNCVALG